MSAALGPLTIARVTLLDRFSLLALPWVVLLSAFVVNIAIFGLLKAGGDSGSDNVTGGMASIFVYLLVLGILSAAQGLGLSQLLSSSRRTFYLGTMATGAGLALVDGLGLAILAAVEPATGGWGVDMTFFRWPGATGDGFASTWLLYGAGLCLAFIIGTTYAATFRRWGVAGSWFLSLAFALVAVLVTALVVAVPGIGAAALHAAAAITPAGVGGMILALAVLFAAVTWLVLRRAPAR